MPRRKVVLSCVLLDLFFFLEKIVKFLTEYYSDSGDDVGKIYVYAEQLVCVCMWEESFVYCPYHTYKSTV